MNFRNRWDNYPYRIESVLKAYGFDSAEDMKLAAGRGKIVPEDIFRFKGMGNRNAPGKFPQYLFNLPSRMAKVNQSILDNLGAGI